MTAQEAFDVLEGVMAFEEGCIDSGIRDRRRQAQAEEVVRSLPPSKFHEELMNWTVEAYLSPGQRELGYGAEDALAFVRWLSREVTL